MEKKSKLFTIMIEKLQHDKDKYERMFAAQYLAKYQFEKSKEFLKKASEDPDPEVAECVQQYLEKAEKQPDKTT
ncbi:MAG: HEAT repeat domain-containing protein [Candidatus Hermodarchaeota archaeon]